MTRWKIYNQDVVEWATLYKKGRFHALLCDPPYHLTSIVKRFGKKGSAPAKFGTDGVFARSSAGFMGQEWDGGDIAFRPETWAAFHDVLYPGAFGMAFSASRNWHRLAVAIEDAGYIIHPTIFLWAQGQGFPKATNISKQLIHADAESEDSEMWKGHRYGLQALKPAVEPIIVFQKPYDGKPLENITDTGAGALNIDDARIPLENGDEYTINQFDDGMKPWGNGAGHKYKSKKIKKETLHTGTKHGGGEYKGWGFKLGTSKEHPNGRWPSNLILDGEAAAHLDKQAVDVGASGKASGPTHRKWGTRGIYGGAKGDGQDSPFYGDNGGASRFFYVVQDKLDESDPVYYCGKVSRKEREAGTEKNNHPTLKPIDLSRYLATLLLPPEEYAPRRILVPFSGAGSEMIGAGLAGWEQIVGIEFDTKNGYVDIAEQRLEHWLK